MKKQMSKPSRRELLAGLTGGAFLLSSAPLAWSESFDSAARVAADAEYMFEPGLNYLNTAALGPTPRSVLDQVMIAFDQINESVH